nr:MAG TPA: hypothetical protein [Caudoviricetes sp.]
MRQHKSMRKTVNKHAAMRVIFMLFSPPDRR